jgi:hypothetical protein
MSSNVASTGTENDAQSIVEIKKKKKDKKTDASTGAKAAGIRAISSQLVAFYFRAPIKAFFRSRVEYVNDIPYSRKRLANDSSYMVCLKD